MVHKQLLTILLACTTAAGFAQRQGDRQAILQVLEVQQAAWNRGDIAAFMQGYWHNDSLTFVGSQGPQYGWQTTMDRYLRTYDTPEKMGTLKFDILKLEQVGKKDCILLGKWHLSRTVGDVGGYFTLVLRKMKDGWKIVYDHTS
ncbi:MAG TPA: DUF4440 domain-containing protein [Phnomibacter sp.]|nr:DUF4440 domain-containing protein [Phnomibacter sp.]